MVIVSQQKLLIRLSLMKLHFSSIALFLVACGSDKGVTVFNPNPEAQISSHSDGDEVLEGYVITFTGNVDDAKAECQCRMPMLNADVECQCWMPMLDADIEYRC